MANLEEILKSIDNMKPEDLYLVLQKLGYDGDANELKQEIEKLFDDEESEFVSGGQNELSRRVGAGILGLLTIMPSITSDAFANDLNNSVTTPVRKNINKNNSKKINWQDIKNKGKQFAKEMNLPDKKALGAFGVTSLAALAIGYGLKSLTTPSKTVELSPEKMNQVKGLATSSAQKDFKNKNFDAWKSGLQELLINWFFDEEDKKREIDLSVVVKPNISMQLICSETLLDNIYVNFKSQEMSLRNYIEQAVKNKKYRYSPDLLVYLLGVYNSTYIQSYDFVKLEEKNTLLQQKEQQCETLQNNLQKERENCEDLKNKIKNRKRKLKQKNKEINELKNKIQVHGRFNSDGVTETDQILSFALEVAYKCGLNPPEGEVGSVAAFSCVLDDILKRYSTLDREWILYYNTGNNILLGAEPLTMQELGQYYNIQIEPDGDSLSFTEGIKVLQQKYGLPFDKNFMLTLAQSCQEVFLLGAEKANEFDSLNKEVDSLNKEVDSLNKEVNRKYAESDYQFDDVGHTYHPEDYNKKKLKDKMNVNSRRKKEHKTTETFERFMRKVASKERQNFGDQTYVEISELINCIDDPEILKLFSDKRSDFKNKRKIKRNTKISDYNDIYLGELPENENYFDIDDDLENPVTETRDDEIITSDTVLERDEEPVRLPDNPRDTATIKLNPTRTKQRQTEIKHLKSKQEKTDWKILKYEPKETTYDITPKTGKIRKTKK